MACTGKENLQETLFLPGSNAEPRQKESTSLAASASSSSKIPVLSKGRTLPELKPSQHQQGQLQQACLPSVGSKAIEIAKMPHTGSVPGAALLKAEAGSLLQSISREPLGEMQLSSSGHRNEGSGLNGKEAGTVEFVPDVAALASILSNTGLTKHMVSATHKPSLARHVPLRGSRACSAGVGTARGTLCTGTSAAHHVRMSHISRLTSKGTDNPQSCTLTLDTQQLKTLSATFQSLGPGGENAFPLVSHMSSSSTGKFGRVSCRSTQGLKGLEKSEASGTQLAGTPGDRCSAVDYSPHGLARRVPIACPQSLQRSPWTCNRVPVSSCTQDKRVGTLHPTELEKVKRTGRATPKFGAVSSKQDGTAVPWEKIAVRLFDDKMAGSAKKVRAVPVIPPGMEKLQRIELLAQLLQKEMNGVLDCDVAPSLEELHKLLSAHCLPALESPRRGLLTTPLQDPGPTVCEPGPVSIVAVAPEPSATPSTSSQHPACPCPSVSSLQPPSCHTSSTAGQAKQQLRDLLSAPQRFHEACLNDECAFYTARVTSTTQPPVQRCKEPVAAVLDAHDAMHFIPISAPLSPPLMEGERSSPS